MPEGNRSIKKKKIKKETGLKSLFKEWGSRLF